MGEDVSHAELLDGMSAALAELEKVSVADLTASETLIWNERLSRVQACLRLVESRWLHALRALEAVEALKKEEEP